MKRFVLVLFWIALVITFTSCGRKNISEELEETEDQDREVSVADGKSLKTKLGITEDTWSEEFAVNGKKVKHVSVSANISVPDTDHLCVLSMKEAGFTDERKKEILEKLCDKDSIYVFDEENPPKWFLEQSVKKIDYMLGFVSQTNDEGALEITDGETYEELQKEKKQYLEKENSAPERGEKPLDFNEEFYIATVNGEQGQFEFFDDSILKYSLTDNCKTEKEGIPQNAEISYNWSEMGEVNNLCSMTEEQAVQAAKDFIQNMGYMEYGTFSVSGLAWTCNTYDTVESWVEGYKIVFTRQVDDILQGVWEFLTYRQDYQGEVSVVPRYGIERITVYINDRGIIECDIEYPYSVEEVLSDATALLSFEQVQEVFRDIIKKESDPLPNYGEEELDFKNLDLAYFRVVEEDSYALIPVWILYSKSNMGFESDIDVYEHLLMINAIDGSQIDFVEELFTYEEMREE